MLWEWVITTEDTAPPPLDHEECEDGENSSPNAKGGAFKRMEDD
eukprot:gene9626-26892_t